MTNGSTNNLIVDPKRIEMLEQAVEDFRAFFETSKVSSRIKMMIAHQFRKYYFVMPPMWRVGLRTMNWKNRMLPDFSSTGAIRSGTSNLSNYILQHPCIVMPFAKELATHLPRESFIRAQFPTLKEKAEIEAKYGVAKTGNCTPILPSVSWVYWGKGLNPEMKVVITLRNPVDRAISHWRWNTMVAGVFTNDPIWRHMPEFEESMRVEMQDFANGGCGFHLFSGTGGTSFLRHSIYLPFLRVLYDTIGKDRVLIINADEFFKDPVPEVKKVYKFLGLPEIEPVKVKERNPSPAMKVEPAMREELVEFFEPQNQLLYEYLDRDFGWS